MEFEIIDFHTHPFLTSGTNICSHKDFCNMSAENTKKDLMNLGVSKICGSVIGLPAGITNKDSAWKRIKACNDEALILKEITGSRDGDTIYEIVEDETELRAVADVFENLLEDVSLTDGEEL